MRDLEKSIRWKLNKIGFGDKINSIQCSKFSDPTMNEEVTFWEVDGMPIPDSETLQRWNEEYLTVGVFEENFSVKQFEKDCESMLLPSEKINLMQYLRGFEAYIEAKNFTALKNTINYLFGIGKISQAERDNLKTVFEKQGIALDNY